MAAERDELHRCRGEHCEGYTAPEEEDAHARSAVHVEGEDEGERHAEEIVAGELREGGHALQPQARADAAEGVRRRVKDHDARDEREELPGEGFDVRRRREGARDGVGAQGSRAPYDRRHGDADDDADARGLPSAGGVARADPLAYERGRRDREADPCHQSERLHLARDGEGAHREPCVVQPAREEHDNLQHPPLNAAHNEPRQHQPKVLGEPTAREGLPSGNEEVAVALPHKVGDLQEEWRKL